MVDVGAEPSIFETLIVLLVSGLLFWFWWWYKGFGGVNEREG